jgi:subtilase family protein
MHVLPTIDVFMNEYFRPFVFAGALAGTLAACAPAVSRPPGIGREQPAPQTRRVVIEFFDDRRPAVQSSPAQRFLATLHELIDFTPSDICTTAARIPGREGRPSLVSGTLRSGQTFDALVDRIRSGDFSQVSASASLDPSVDFGPPSRTKAVVDGDDAAAVATQVDVPRLAKDYGDGSDVLLVVVDSGLTESKLKGKLDKNFSWTSDPKQRVGEADKRSHANMVAFDARIAARNVSMADYVIGKRTTSSIAACGLAHLSEMLERDEWRKFYNAVVVSNAWWLQPEGSTADIAPTNECQPNDVRLFNANVRQNPCHALYRSVVEVASQADVVFAAGNDDKPLDANGNCVNGAAGTIYGANSLSSVLTVSAVNLQGQHLKLSSVGPGMIASRKPDISGVAGFKGSGVVGANDNGSSAATGVVAGVVAAMRSAKLKSTPEQLRKLLIHSAHSLSGGVWDCRFGAGRIQVPPREP